VRETWGTGGTRRGVLRGAGDRRRIGSVRRQDRLAPTATHRSPTTKQPPD